MLMRVVLLLAVVVMPMAARGSGFILLSYPLPLSTDGTRVRSSLYLQLEVKDYGILLEKLGTQAPDLREAALLKALQAIRASDVAALSRVWVQPQPTKDAPAKAAEARNADLKKMVDLFHTIYGNMPQITVVNQALAGAKSIFVVEIPDLTKLSRRVGFVVSTGSDGKAYVDSAMSEDKPVELLFVSMMMAASMDPAAYKPQLNLALKHRYAFPLEGKGNPGPHPVILQFAGEAMNFKVVDKRQGAPNPLLTFYRQAYSAVSGRDAKTFIAMHTAGSERDLKNWFAGLNEKLVAKFYEKYGEEKYVKFVLNADPIYIIFYSSDPGDDWSPDLLDYEYVYKDPATGAYRLTNTTYSGYLDDILRNPALFNPLTLRRAKEAPGEKPPALSNVAAASSDGKKRD